MTWRWLAYPWAFAALAGLTPTSSTAAAPSRVARAQLMPVPAHGPDTAALRLDLNIPAYRLDVYAGPERLRSYRVAVGMRSNPTPRGRFTIAEVEWNPWWIPPERPWAAGEAPEPPGPRNRVGRAKLRFLPLYLIHGTPFVESLGAARSRGCIRLSNADIVDLAGLVHEYASPNLDADTVVRIQRELGATRRISLARVVPFAIRYDLAEVRDGRLALHPDIYRLSGNSRVELALRALDGSGVAMAEVDTSLVRALVHRSLTRPVEVPVDAVSRPNP